MAEINAKVEYDNLLGFPDYNGSVINYLKSTESLYGFNNVSFNDIKQDLNLFNDNNIFNCVTEKNPNLIFYNNNYKLNLNKKVTYQHQLPHLFKLFTKLVNLATFIITNIHTNFFKIKM